MATQELHSRGLKEWFLPTDIPPNCWHSDIPDPATIIRLQKLAAWCPTIIEHHDRPFDMELLRLVYHQRAESMGFASIDGALKFNQLRLAFRNAYRCLEKLPGFSFLSETSHDHGGFLGSILLNIGLNKHPLRHLLLMDFLFGDPNAFIAEYENVLSKSIRLNSNELWTELANAKNQLKMLVTDAGISVEAAAKRLGIPLSQATSLLREEGIEYKRRHRVLDQKNEGLLIKLLNAGEERDVIASKLGITKSFIDRYIAKYPELRNIWRSGLQQKLT